MLSNVFSMNLKSKRISAVGKYDYKIYKVHSFIKNSINSIKSKNHKIIDYIYEKSFIIKHHQVYQLFHAS